MEASSPNTPPVLPTGHTINRDNPEHPFERLNIRPRGYMESLRVDQGLSGADQGAAIPAGEVLSPDGPEIIIPDPTPTDPDPGPTNPDPGPTNPDPTPSDTITFVGSTLKDDAGIYLSAVVPGLEVGMLITGPGINPAPPIYDPGGIVDPYGGQPYIGGFRPDFLQIFLNNGSPDADQTDVTFTATRFTPPPYEPPQDPPVDDPPVDPPTDPDTGPGDPQLDHPPIPFIGSTIASDASIYVDTPVAGLEAGMLITGPGIEANVPIDGPFDPTATPDPYEGQVYIGGFRPDLLQIFLSNGAPTADQTNGTFTATPFSPAPTEPDPSPEPEDPSTLRTFAVSRRMIVTPSVATVSTAGAASLARGVAIPSPSLLRVRRVPESRPVSERIGSDLSATGLRRAFLARMSRFAGLPDTLLVRGAIGQEGVQFMNEARELGVSVEVIKEAMG